MPKTKKEHYVPQSYLEKWCSDNGQVFVFDKEQETSRINSIEDVASENYFYDLKIEDILSESGITIDQLNGFDIKIPDPQYIEKHFANHIEGLYKQLLERIVSRVREMNHWEIINCFFIQPEKTKLLSIFLAIQYIRVKEIRNTIGGLADMISQVLSDLNADQETIDKYTLSKSGTKLLHQAMILDNEVVLDLANVFSQHNWILLKNNTSMPFFTSDNPIGTIAHIKHPYLSMAGLASKGVEVFFPVSPDLLLIMLEKSYHLQSESKHCRIIEIDDPRTVEHYNIHCIINSGRCAFSQKNDFSIVKRMKAMNPNALHVPKATLSWGEKTYTPSKK